MDEALQHVFLSAYHDPDDEPTADAIPMDLDNLDMTVQEWQGSCSYRHIQLFLILDSKNTNLTFIQVEIWRVWIVRKTPVIFRL